jgi:hypothetical protein
MKTLLDLYQEVCNYTINSHIQKLNIEIDIETLKNDILKFITSNNFSFNEVSLRLPASETNYTDTNEKLEETAFGAFSYASIDNTNKNTKPNQDYTCWHPALEGTYVTTLVPKLESLTGLKIGRVRLGWLMPNSGYPMHIDLEPMRLHIPIITNNLSFFINNNNLYHMEYGSLYHLITTDIHTTHNFGFIPRLHLIFSTYGDKNIENSIKKLTEYDVTKNNFLEHIPKGIDDLTLSYLLKLYLNDRAPTESVSDTIYPIQKLRNILNKKN